MTNIKSPKKLIEVALPLDDINREAAREKSIRHGHPSTLHLWWARRPLAAARAVLFAQMVNDPGYQQGGGFKYGVNKEEAARRREELFDIIRELVKWENTNNEEVLERARAEIRRSWREVCELNQDHPQAAELFNPDKLPAFHDPFAGGGAIPLEAQRLGLEAWASDLNPVAVMINKAMIEIPPKFAGLPPVFRNEWRGVRKKRGDVDALSGDESLEQSDGGGRRGVSAGAQTAEGRDLRHEVTDHASSGVCAGQHCRGMDAGVETGEGAVSGDCSGVGGGSGNPVDPVRTDRMVSGERNQDITGIAGRSQPHADSDAKKAERRLVDPLVPHSSSLFPGDWPGATGLAEDVRRYGHWMREEAEKRIGHLYPKVKITKEMAASLPAAPGGTAQAGRPDLKPYEGQELTVIAWLWTRTVKCPNPACGCEMPLLSSFVLSSKKGKEGYLISSYKDGNVYFDVSLTKPTNLGDLKKGFKRGMSGIFECINCGTVTSRNYTAEQATTNGLGAIQTAVVCEGNNGRVYLPARYSNIPEDFPEVDKTGLEVELSPNPRDVWCRNFGLNTPADLFTPRQLVALTTFSDLVQEAREKATADALAALRSGMSEEKRENSGSLVSDSSSLFSNAAAYGDAVAVYLALGVSRMSDIDNALCRWEVSKTQVRNLFGRQAIPMVWDFAENNIFNHAAGDFLTSLTNLAKVLDWLFAKGTGTAQLADATNQSISLNKVVSTDPPYYDNIGYADLSDFFYVWLRRSLKPIYPGLFATLAVPKAEELAATPYRHGSKERAEAFFLEGMKKALHKLAEQAHPAFPVTIYYAFKQSETKEGSTTSTGWETFLEAVIQAGFSIDGTWPMRTELGNRMISSGTNALASSVVLVCRKRPENAESISRKDFQRQLRREMPEALEAMTCLSADLPANSSQAGGRQVGGKEGASPIAPVDLAQAAIGPGMAIFSQYEAVLNQDGSRMTVHDALILINRAITEYLSPESGSFDNDTQFCSAWFEQYGWKNGPFGEADVLARAKGTSVDGVVEAGVLESGGGKVRLLKWKEYPADWDPARDDRTPVWEALHHMIRRLNEDGESAAGELLARMPEKGEPLRQLAYHLYTLCERAGWAEDARAYNELIGAWHAIVTASHEVGHKGESLELDL